jgi:hypothetical protein
MKTQKLFGCALPLAAAALAALAGCMSVVNNIGDSAIEAALGREANTAETNRIDGAVATTNAWSATSGRSSRGGLIISTTVQKNVSPNTTTTVTPWTE